MFVVWGQKKTQKRLGFVADLCPVCRDVRRFRVIRIGVTTHVYFLSVGSGRLATHEAECQSCGLRMEITPDVYRQVVKTPPETIEELVRISFPDLVDARAARLEHEARLRAGEPLAPGVRHRLIRESLGIFSSLAEERLSGSARLDGRSAWSLAATVAIPVALLVAGESVASRATYVHRIAPLAGLLFLTGFLLTLAFLATGASRWVRGPLLRRLANHLRPLAPTEEELDEHLTALRGMGLKLARKIGAARLVEAIEYPTDELAEINSREPAVFARLMGAERSLATEETTAS